MELSGGGSDMDIEGDDSDMEAAGAKDADDEDGPESYTYEGIYKDAADKAR